MKHWLLALNFLVTTSAFAGGVSAYFNHNHRNSYTDPYRNISRAGDNLEEVLLRSVRTAKKSIFIAVQEFRLPLLAEALIAKKKEGVDVRIVLEHDYNFTVSSQRDIVGEGEYEASKLSELRALVDVNQNGKIEKLELETRDAIYMLQAAKVPLIDDTADSSSGSGLMHHKFMIVDGKTTVVSTANFTLSCIHGDVSTPTSRGNSNSMVVVESLAFSKIFTEEFSQLWGNGKRGTFGLNKTYRGPVTTSVGGTKITVQFSPTSQRYNWEESTNGLIGVHLAKATKSIKAALFVFSDQRLADVMEKSHNKGATVGVIMEPKFAYRNYSELLDLMGIEMPDMNCDYEADNHPWKIPAEQAGMSNLPKGDVLHHKFAVIDKKTVVVGSENWSDSANYTNDETLIVIQDVEISDQYTQEYDRLSRNATLGAPAWLKKQIDNQEAACRRKGLY